MPKELRDSLVCWHSPNLQGLTNAELFNSNNEYIGGLHDLSGNGHDMDLHGFDGIEGGGHVDEEGNLVFDHMNDYIGALNGIVLSDYSVFGDVISLGQAILIKGALKSGALNYPRTIYFGRDSYAESFASSMVRNTNIDFSDGVYWQTKYRVQANKNIYDTHIGSAEDKASYPLFIGCNTPSAPSSINTIDKLRAVILFDRTLTDSEIEWVKTNMLVSQEPSKRNVTLWLVDEESGTFDKFKTLQVQNGNMVGKCDEEGNLVLPVYDIDNIHQTSMTWYTDVECTEEYSGEYITEDTFLYAKKVKTSDNMLAQLDNVILEDGTTAREHLVCWYSPKWQGLTKESVLTDATLADLSGNGYDMTLYGFSEDEQIIGEDGALMFDGVDDWGMCNNLPSSVSNVSFMLKAEVDQTSNGKYCLAISNYGSGTTNIRIQGKNYLRFVNNTEIKQYYSGDYLYVDSTRFNDTAYSTTPIALQQYYFLGRLRSSLSGWGRVVFTTSLIFDHPLTTDEESKVKQILKLN